MKFPWEDPVLFSFHFRSKWLEFFKITRSKHFAKQIGGMKDQSWVMEIQDRGSLHIYMVLWTERTVQELIDMDMVHTCSLKAPLLAIPLCTIFLTLYKFRDVMKSKFE